ncbi:hypothetical protein [Streptomyces sp. NRRL S-1813]|uniref:hypothetical protein n=1 Tax=Streptomyces sp. NRRL S-1813 TaxID=1463888 RepID=UPI0004C9DF44|nr:hypothetical protein [Streptomyces sp. NRRL S-1813]
MTPYARLHARLSAARPLSALRGRRARRAAAVRAERTARPTRPAHPAPLFTTCCPTWPATGGRAHHRTCHITTEETGR